MPPKNKNPEDGVSGQLDSILEQLKAMNERLAAQDTRFSRLEKLLTETQSENKTLKEENEKQKLAIDQLKERVNHLEQRNRANNVRVFNLPLTGDTSDNNNVADQLFNKVFKPVLRGAMDRGKLTSFPLVSEVIEVAHILPSKAAIKPILCKFTKPIFKQLILTHKKDFGLRAPGKEDRPGPLCFPIYEDATRDAFNLMKKLAADDRVLASWISGGDVRFRLHASDSVHRIRSLSLDFEDHFKNV